MDEVESEWSRQNILCVENFVEAGRCACRRSVGDEVDRGSANDEISAKASV